MKVRIRKQPRKHSRYVPKPKYPSEGHTGFWASDGETTAHIYGDPNMSAETFAALLKLAKCAGEAIECNEIESKANE